MTVTGQIAKFICKKDSTPAYINDFCMPRMFIVDNKGRRQGVILDIFTYKKIMELLEDLADIQYVEKHRKDKGKPLEEFITELKKMQRAKVIIRRKNKKVL